VVALVVFCRRQSRLVEPPRPPLLLLKVLFLLELLGLLPLWPRPPRDQHQPGLSPRQKPPKRVLERRKQCKAEEGFSVTPGDRRMEYNIGRLREARTSPEEATPIFFEPPQTGATPMITRAIMEGGGATLLSQSSDQKVHHNSNITAKMVRSSANKYIVVATHGCLSATVTAKAILAA
jgi:hypothetical protein